MPLRILIVEDETAHAEAILRSLEGVAQAELRVMGSLAEFRNHGAAWSPDLVLLDMNLPDGRATEALPDPTEARPFPIIVMTSYGSERTAVEALKAGAFDYLVKSPEAFSGLPRTVEQLLREWKLRQEAQRTREALVEAHRFNQQIIQCAQEGIIVYGPDLRYLVWNTFMEDFTGLPAGEVLGRLPEEVFPFLREVGMLARLERTLAGETLGPTDFQFQVPGTEKFGWAIDTSVPFRNSQGDIIGVIGTVSNLGERKRIDASLRESEARNRALLSAIPDLIFTNRRDGEFLDVQVADHTTLLVPPETFLHQKVQEVMPAPLGGQLLKAFGKALDTGVVQELEYQLPLAAGISHFEARMVPFSLDSVITIVRDITVEKCAGEALRASDQRFRDLVESTDGLVWEADAATFQFTSVSANAERLLGYPNSDWLVPGFWAEHLHPEDRERAVQYCVACTGRLENHDFEYRFLAQDGRVVWLRDIVKVISEQGSPRWLRGLMVDITRAKGAEAALKESERQLRESQALTRLGSYAFDLQTGMFTTSEILDELFGIDDTYVRSFKGWAALVHPDWRTDMMAYVAQEVVGQGKPFDREYQYIRQNTGEVRWAHGLGRLELNEAHEPIRLAGTIRDITERKEAEVHRLQLEAQLHQSQKMESLGLLAGGIAHDMNNVLGAILGLATAHLELQSEQSPTRRAFDTIVKACTRGGKLVKGLLSLSRKGLAEVGDVDLNALVEEEVSLLERTTLAKVELKVDLAPELPRIRGDAGALSHALMNLCVNAVDAMPENGSLILRTRRAGSWVEVEVEDTGTGMPQAVLDKALEPFFTTKPQGKGTGLGLSIVYSTVKAHEGVMELHSSPGNGTRILLRFPIAALPEATPQPRAETTTNTGSLKGSPIFHVLLVDDDELIASSVQELIQLLGYTTTHANSGEEALGKLEAGLDTDVVILDLNMPGLGGAETLPLLRELRPHLPVLLATGRVEQKVLDLVQAYPQVALMSKPFTIDELRDHLATALLSASH